MTVAAAAGSRTETAAPAPVAWGEEPWTVTQESVRAIQSHWLDCLDAGTEPATSGRDDLGTLALVEAAFRSAGDGRPIAPRSF